MTQNSIDLKKIYSQLHRLIKKYGKAYDLRKQIIGSTASTVTQTKPSLHVYGKKAVKILNRKPQPTYVCGVILQKHFVSLYSMPIYSHPDLFQLSSELRKIKKGKSCFNINRMNPPLHKEIERLIIEGFKLYKKESWI